VRKIFPNTTPLPERSFVNTLVDRASSISFVQSCKWNRAKHSIFKLMFLTLKMSQTLSISLCIALQYSLEAKCIRVLQTGPMGACVCVCVYTINTHTLI
jgi:hypothetical protein